MSIRQYYKKASKDEGALEKSDSEPVVNRFSDTRRVDQRRHEVLDYLMLGYEPEQIAEYLDEELSVIRRDMERIVEIGYEAREDDIVEVRDEIMRMLRLAARESHQAFKMSQGKVETKTVKYGEGGDPGNGDKNIEEEKVKTEVQSGDAKHMRNFIDAAEKMGKVSGAQKHKEVEVKNAINKNTVNILSPDRSQMPEEFDRWTKKPDDAEIPDGKNEIDPEEI